MKRKIKKLAIKLTVIALLIAGLLLIIILNPILTYAKKTIHNSYTVFHNTAFSPTLLTKLDQSTELLKRSEFYNPKLPFKICLNDGAKYPQLIGAILGPAFAWGFDDKVVLQGEANYKENNVALNGHKWNFTQLLAHEMTHCLQFQKLGFWNSNPVANIPNWKWEGYAEYVSRQSPDQKVLSENIIRLFATDESKWAIKFADGTIASRAYYHYWILIQYCMDIKKMNYKQILADTTNEQTVKHEMMSWFYRQDLKYV